MSKGQKRGNREQKKPKQNKAVVAPTTTGLLKAAPMSSAIGMPKKRPGGRS